MTKDKAWLASAACAFAIGIGAAIAQAPPIGQGGASPGPPFVARGNWMVVGGATPKFDPASCTPAPFISGSDTAGVIGYNVTTAATSCRFLWANPLVNADVNAWPTCSVTNVENLPTGVNPTLFFPDRLSFIIHAPAGVTSVTYMCMAYLTK